MSELVFYEKPGCMGNQQQQAELRSQGVQLRVLDLLGEAWTPGRLRSFFGDTPVPEWFNLSAPPVKSGAVNINDCREEEALKLMLADPLLIRRPLLEMGGTRQSGYVDGPVLERLGIRLRPGEDLQSCPMGDVQGECLPVTGRRHEH